MKLHEADIRDYEDEYYASRPPVVLEAIEARDEGWRLAKRGQLDEGLDLVYQSQLGLIGHRARPDYRFEREYFATTARRAQIEAMAGKFGAAASSAAHAIRNIALPGLDVLLDDDGDAFEHRPDQYSITFGGSMALILATSNRRYDRSAGKKAAVRARVDACWSEDLENVIFADRKMAPEDRVDTQRKFEKMAIAANLAYLLPPVPVVRERFAGTILRKAVGIS